MICTLVLVRGNGVKIPRGEPNVTLPLLLIKTELNCTPKKLRVRFMGTLPVELSSFPGRLLLEKPGRLRKAPPPGKVVPVTWTVWVALLLDRLGSVSFATTLAVLSNVPAPDGTARGTRMRLTAWGLPTAREL